MIIVGVAIAVGITIFNNQAYNANQQAVSSEINNYAQMAVQWWKTPTAQGGGGQISANVTQTAVANWIGFASTTPFANLVASDNGEFRVTAVDNTANAETVTIIGLGKEKRGANFPLITSTVNLRSGAVTTTVGTGTGFPTSG